MSQFLSLSLSRYFRSLLPLFFSFSVVCFGLFILPARGQVQSEVQSTSNLDRTERFRIANQLVSEGRPSEAIVIYEELLKTPSGLLYYNSGVAYQMMGKLGLAKALYLSASAYPETREASLQNLDQVESLLPFKMAKIPPYPWQRFYHFLVEDLGMPFLFWVAGLGLYLFTGGLIGYMFTTKQRFSKIVIFTGLTLLFSMSWVLLSRHVEIQNTLNGVITVSSVTLIEDPALDLESTDIAYEGALVKADLRESRPEEGWYFVTLQNGAKGWLMESSFKSVPFY